MFRFPAIAQGVDVAVSATMYLTYIRCPDQALARHGGAYPGDSRTSFRGGLAHRVFARHLSSGPISEDEFTQVCREEIGQGLNQKIAAVGMRPSELAGVISEVGDMYQRFKRFPTDGFRSSEVFIEVEPAPGVILRGSIDAVFEEDGAVRLVDWKTGELGQSHDQLWFYAALWALHDGELPARVEAASVATGERWDAVTSQGEIERTIGAVAGLVGEIRRAVAAGDTLKRSPGRWCGYCPVLASCEDGQSAAAVFRAG